jgi:hypothetical protein
MHVVMVAVQGIPFSKSTQPDLTELYGNIYVDQKSANLCVSVEGVYVEMDPELLDYWRGLKIWLTGSH